MRVEFTKKTKLAEFDAAQGLCRNCGVKLCTSTGIEYDHATALAIGGTADRSNCVVLCRNCHRHKTSSEDMPRIAKARRNHRNHAGVKRPRTIRSWRKFSGEIVIAPRER